ncbi:MAG: cytidylyltransferase domain-containing protein [Candidatus Odinarchaeota archaeon]
MFKGRKILCTICARGGSKGIKNKNIRLLNGKPLIYYSIAVAKKCDYIDNIIVSTDSEEIASIASSFGVEVPFMRPKELALDHVGRVDVIIHATSTFEAMKETKWDLIVDLGVASPLRNVRDVKNAIELLVEKNADNVVSATPSHRNPYFNMAEVDKAGKVSYSKQLPAKITQRQDAPEVFDLNDSILVWTRETLFSDKDFFNDGSSLYIMPTERSVDIDTEIDFKIAECLIKDRRDLIS